jgi:hypothetical protein
VFSLSTIIAAFMLLQPAAPANPSASPALTGGADARPAQSDPKPAAPADAPPPVDPKVADLLARLEKSNATLRTAVANIRYLKVFSELEGGDKHIRDGVIYFAQELSRDLAPALAPPVAGQPPRRGFAIHLKSLEIDAGGPTNILRDEPRRWVFDGVWLTEFRDAEKQFTKQRVVADGDDRDPLRIGQGPLPLPFGQRPADMLAVFDLQALGAMDELPENTPPSLKKRLEGSSQLKLIPRAGTRQAKDFREIRIWYRAEDLLPIFARTSKTDDTRDEVLLTDLKLNAPIPPGTIDTTTPRAQDGWKGSVNER